MNNWLIAGNVLLPAADINWGDAANVTAPWCPTPRCQLCNNTWLNNVVAGTFIHLYTA
jgi:hypothetical protein